MTLKAARAALAAHGLGLLDFGLRCARSSALPLDRAAPQLPPTSRIARVSCFLRPLLRNGPRFASATQPTTGKILAGDVTAGRSSAQ
jgi:hypothetical protein